MVAKSASWRRILLAWKIADVGYMGLKTAGSDELRMAGSMNIGWNSKERKGRLSRYLMLMSVQKAKNRW